MSSYSPPRAAYKCTHCGQLLNLIQDRCGGLRHIRECQEAVRKENERRMSTRFGDHPAYALFNPSTSHKYSDPSCVVPNEIYLGGRMSSRDPGFLLTEKIRTVLNVASDVPPLVPLYIHMSIGHKHLPAVDVPTFDIRPMFETAFDFIEQAPKPVFVHCAAGVSRSATIVIAYLMRKNSWTLLQALDHTRRCRDVVYPNRGFFKALIMYEQELFNGAEPSIPLEMLELHEDQGE
eukprot:TRINITY_DN10915_c0_g1_i1.p1 TRINITY_DN10915_c0_g1~~TRINITY_DN10915_c0_g1_i1.p1  ORF type:complete len:234 (+),score=57.38 TRINITY_DN10915_c0_g1_i1:55-756(+)